MMQVILLFTLVFPVYGTPSKQTAKERAVLSQLKNKFTRFQEALNETDDKFAKMRSAVVQNRNREASSLAEEIAPLVSLSQRRFTEIEKLCDEAEQKGLKLLRPGYRSDISRDLASYLSARHNNRFGTGGPMELHLAAWRGLSVGKKLEKLPTPLDRTGKIARFPLLTSDSVLIMTTNGGFIRGRFEGTAGNSYIVREILPNSFRKRQIDEGHYRMLTFDQVARVEIIRKPETHSLQENPLAVITEEGVYSRFFALKDHVWRMDLRPSDVELLELIKEKRFNEAKMKKKLDLVDPETAQRPAYTPIYFYDCWNLL